MTLKHAGGGIVNTTSVSRTTKGSREGIVNGTNTTANTVCATEGGQTATTGTAVTTAGHATDEENREDQTQQKEKTHPDRDNMKRR